MPHPVLLNEKPLPEVTRNSENLAFAVQYVPDGGLMPGYTGSETCGMSPEAL
jgi:hypothetical protein